MLRLYDLLPAKAVGILYRDSEMPRRVPSQKNGCIDRSAQVLATARHQDLCAKTNRDYLRSETSVDVLGLLDRLYIQVFVLPVAGTPYLTDPLESPFGADRAFL